MILSDDNHKTEEFSEAMKTNLPSNTAVRSFGSPQGYFICETIIEEIAGRLKKPVEAVREINMCTKENAVTPWGQPMEFYNASWSSSIGL